MPNLYLEKLRAEAQAKISQHDELLNKRQECLQEIKEIDAELANTDISQAVNDIVEINKILDQLEPQVEQPIEEESTEEIVEE